MPPTQADLATASWQRASDQLNWSLIAEEMETAAAGRMTDYDWDDARQAVFDGLESWLGSDLLNFEILEVEKPIATPLVRGVLDLVFRIKDKPLQGAYAPHAGRLLIRDWKTSKNTLSNDWRERHIASWQSPIYGVLALHENGFSESPALFEFCGISRARETKTILLEYGPGFSDLTYGFLYQVDAMRTALGDGKTKRWPQNRPSACNAYGRECVYLEDCAQHKEPFVQVSAKPLSYSGLTTFLQCPEKYRRQLEDGSTDSEETIFGSVVHAGLAEAYKQAKGWQL